MKSPIAHFEAAPTRGTSGAKGLPGPFCAVLMLGAASIVDAAAPPSATRLLDAVKRLESDVQSRAAVLKALAPSEEDRAETDWPALLRALRGQGARPTADGARISDMDAIEFFESRVRSVLAVNCFECHGPEKQKGGLRLDSRESMLMGGDHGPVFVAGDAAHSLLTQVLGYEGELKMPPSGKLPTEALEAIAHWINLGAPWPQGDVPPSGPTEMERRLDLARRTHWAFQPISEPAVPTVSKADWVASPLDAFILGKLEALGLEPSDPADRYTLIRRATYDLTGLPPTMDEVAAFVNDPAPDAYEKVIDRLLASPRYGERWGRYWLDVARYADTRGYVFQQERTIPFSYTYRDYVIRAFNEDLPYDEFVVQQLAADQLDLGGDKRALAALGFITLNRHFLGNIHDITDDRIDVVTRGLLGLTVSCARCHDHKYDPIPIEDYYSLYGVFRSSVEPDELPLIEEPDSTNPQYQAFLTELKEAEKAERDLIKSLHVDMLSHARDNVEAYLLAAHDAKDLAEEEPFKTLARDRGLHWQLVGWWRDYLKKKSEAHDPVFAPWTAFAALPAKQFSQQASQLVGRFEEYKDSEHPMNPRIAAAFGGEPPSSMADVAARYSRVLREVDEEWMKLVASELQLAQAGDSGLAALPTALADPADEQVRQVLYGPDSPANIRERDLLQLYDVPTQNKVRDKRNAVARVKSTHPGRPNRAMALQDSAQPFDPHVFKRGNPGNMGESVPRRELAVLADGERKPFEHGSGRLEWARRIASKDNPLTARVYVNRVWMHHFDRPLVNTPSDFGLRSEPPSHPELLDYLAARFMAEGWSTKKLHKWIMLSNTYRQSSQDRPEARAVDPENRFLWKQNRRRLDFEALRDSFLSASASLDESMGGPSVDITIAPFTGRRSVYSFIERQNLPGMFRTFDFANPDTHSPKRFRTTVPQQALFLMNSPFLIEQAKRLAARSEIQSTGSARERVSALYRIVYEREPAEEEYVLAERFIADQTAMPEALPVAWQYGYGGVDVEVGALAGFTPLPHFTGNEWRGGSDMPDVALRWLSVRANGGHPGADAMHASVRRWTAPYDGVVKLTGKLKHGDAENGDGVWGFIVSSRAGVLWREHVKGTEAPANVETVEVRAGDTIDFVVACGNTDGWDSYLWGPVVRYTDREGKDGVPVKEQIEWQAELDFAGPTPPPLDPWERYAQVLMLTNEFAFVD